MKKKWVVLIAIVAFLFGLTWQINWMGSYGEMRGRVSIRQRLLGIEFIYSWAAPGFNYPDDWDVRRYQEKFPF